MPEAQFIDNTKRQIVGGTEIAHDVVGGDLALGLGRFDMLGADHAADEASERQLSPGGKIAVTAGERVDSSPLRLFALAQICSILVEQHVDGPAFRLLLLGQRCVGIDAAFDKANDILGLGASLLEGQFLSGAQGVALPNPR